MAIINKKERSRRKIQQQAILLTLQHGFDGFTMQELADASEVSRSSIFNHFPDKVGAVLGATNSSDDDTAEAQKQLDQIPPLQRPPLRTPYS